MLNPLSIPNEVLVALRSVSSIERLLEALNGRIGQLPDDIERTLRRHFDGQRGDLSELHEELVANRRHAEVLPGKVDGLREEIGALRAELSDEIGALRAEVREVLREVAEVRETVEPLQGPAERVARLSDRLPGGD